MGLFGDALTVRALAAGLAVGAVLCFSNMYFGLQTGWVTMGSLQSAILGYGLFQGLGAAKLITQHLTVAENVIVQTTAVATATMPLAAGLVGIIPALGLLSEEDHPGGPVRFTPGQLMGWCFSLAFFGVFVAVPLRYQTIIREKLRFPSGTATASVIKTLHGVESSPGRNNNSSSRSSTLRSRGVPAAALAEYDGQQYSADADSREGATDLEIAVALDSQEKRSFLNDKDIKSDAVVPEDPFSTAIHASASGSRATQQQRQWAQALNLLLWCFAISGTYSIAASWIQAIRVLPIFDWLGLPAATAWGWVLQPSAGYIGQGMIMGPKTAWSMMAGAVTGWAILGPNAKARGWVPGPIKDIETGAAGWLMWLGLALLLGDCFSELGILLLQTLIEKVRQKGCLPVSARSESSRRSSRFAVGRIRSRLDAVGLGFGAGSGYKQVGVLDESVDESKGSGASLGRFGGLLRPGSAESALELSPSTSERALQAAAEGSAAVLEVADSDGHHMSQSLQQQNLQDRNAADIDSQGDEDENHDSDDSISRTDESSWLLSIKFWLPGLMVSTGLATLILSPLMGMPAYEPFVAVLVALLVALLAVRALGQTDLNPVSGVGKISQLVFAVVSPGAVIPNLVAGAIAEAGAQQAGDLMQDFKTAHLLGVPPSSQLVAMLLGSAVSVPLSVGAYLLYTSAWEVPGPTLPAPTAQIWLDMAKLVNGGKLPDHIGPFCAAAAVIAAALPVLQHHLQHIGTKQAMRSSSSSINAAGTSASMPPVPQDSIYAGRRKVSDDGSVEGFGLTNNSSSITTGAKDSWTTQIRRLFAQAGLRLWFSCRARSSIDWILALLPSGVGFAVGMYLTPNWTLPRVIGSVVDQMWLVLSPSTHAAFMMVTASGLVLGEGCASIVTAVVHAATA